MSDVPAGPTQAMAPPATKPGDPMKNVLKNRNFRLLWLGQCTSLLGDQFSMIAVQWLVLLITHDPLALGIALALEGVPRARMRSGCGHRIMGEPAGDRGLTTTLPIRS